MINKNDLVDVVCLSTDVRSNEAKEIKNFLEKNGLKSRIFLEEKILVKTKSSSQLPSISSDARFNQLKKAIESDDSKIIWNARGGYGSGDLLDLMKKMKKPKKEKIFIGFSDITSINNFLIQEWNWKIISAPMLTQLAFKKVNKKSEKAILDLIFGKKDQLKYSLTNISKNKFSEITAQIVGGCMSVMSAHFGTSNQIDWKDKILFLEDIAESGERLDRYFRQIVDVITEKKSFPKAIILGNFYMESSKEDSKNIQIAIKKFVKRLEESGLKFPVFEEKTKCLGHSKDMMPLVLGCNTRIAEHNYLLQNLTK